MHVKVVPPGSYSWGDEPQTQMLKVARAGLRGEDLRVLIKRAGYVFADFIKNAELKPGDIPVHSIALGATEFYGPNRNGDGFKEATCRKCHNSFVKYARRYRNHLNKDPQKSYGYIKASHYNEDLHRIELLSILNGTKEAADRNGGLVADKEMDKLAKGEDIPTSMACKVAYDVCAGCGNKARNRKEYCLGEDEGGMCKRGGMRNRLTMAHNDGFINHVDNPDPSFFDESMVVRGADRTAYDLGIVKSASGLIIGGAELAEKLGLDLPPYMHTDTQWFGRFHRTAVTLAGYEDDSVKEAAVDRAFVYPKMKWNDHGAEKHAALAALCMLKIAMPLDGFAEFFERDASVVDTAYRHLPGIYGRMLKQGENFDDRIKSFLPFGTVTQALYKWAADRAEGYSLEDRFLERRVQLANLYNEPAPQLNQPLTVKVANGAESLALDYAMYKLAFLQALKDRGANLGQAEKLVVRQNYLH